VVGVVAAKAVLVHGSVAAIALLALPQALLGVRYGLDRAQRQPVRQERQGAAALEALHVLEEQRVPAVVTAKGLHCLCAFKEKRQARRCRWPAFHAG